MTAWLEPSTIIAVAGIVGQAAIAWWRVSEMDKRVALLEDCIAQSKEWMAKNGQKIEDLTKDVDELRRKVWNGNGSKT